MAENKEITFQIMEHLGVISENKSGWKKELNRVSWSGREAKLDIRDWSPAHDKMSKGVTLTQEEARALGELLKKLD
ncbi:MAG: hypothetical protein LBG74_00940 [Spirochaetaceae bacterium]|jgi:hypothetical protein|nr:hypothetical protein [Spirochaetaceae bacterium]